MKLFHGSYSNTSPEIKIGAFSLGAGDNVFDGLFASAEPDIASSHGDFVHIYDVEHNPLIKGS
ncbi:hypothetical protein [Klebsiella aerogenes]|uniref:hypothetical protein n=1 Tax=Klebsiella aerogenes TaxID=548 RepID=UPI0027E720B5|nr:hypothetical protein [Klebsiella aerogenes]